ncbi:hypothetical protein JCM8547_005770 [Rhodosporidiobolus lusitaniae]
MTGRTKKPRKSYVEVDSDADWSSGGEERDVGSGSTSGTSRQQGGGRKAKGDTYGTAKPAKKKARRSSSTVTGVRAGGKGVKHKYDADLLLRLPFDLLAEICEHLDPLDLINLALVSKDFRKLFLSTTTRSIWTSMRRRDGYELPDGMDEYSFALLFYSPYCELCASLGAVSFYFLRMRLCRKCRKEKLVDGRQVRKLEHLHSDILDCVQTDNGYYLLSELETVNEELQDAEDEDEQARVKLEKARVYTTKSRRRSSASTDEAKKADAVERYIEEKREQLKEERKGIQRVRNRQSELAKMTIQRRLDEVQRLRDEAAAKKKSIGEDLIANYEWTDAQVAFYQDRASPYRLRQHVAPEASPSDDVHGWRSYRDAIQAYLDEQEAERQAVGPRQLRRDAIEDLHDTLVDELEDELGGIRPSLNEFLDIPEIRALWFPRGSSFDSAAAARTLPLGRTVFKTFVEQRRLDAVRAILSAQNKSIAGSFPVETHGNDFFNLATSSFRSNSYRFGRWQLKLVSYIDFACEARSAYSTLNYSIRKGTSFKQVQAIRTCVAAAGLNEKTATIDDMNQLGTVFRWPTCPRKMSRNSVMNWTNMVQLIMRRGPGVRRLQAGEKVEIEVVSLSSKDVKGKGKAVEQDDDSDMDVDEDSEDEEDRAGSEDESEEEQDEEESDGDESA